MEEILSQIISILASTMRLATPLILCALAGLFSERSGIVDIGLEGKMLAGAFAAATVSYLFSNPELVAYHTICLIGSDAFFAQMASDEGFAQFISSQIPNIDGMQDDGLLGYSLVQSLFNPGDLYVFLQYSAPFIGLLAAILASVLISLIHGLACITFNGNQIISGMALNIMVSGITPALAFAFFGKNRTPALHETGRFHNIDLPFTETFSDIPILGQVYEGLISGHNIFVYVAFLIVPITYWVVYNSRFGLRMRAVGESPKAVDTAGISVSWVRYRSVIITGILCGLAGAFLSTAQGAAFVRDMSAGKGFLALAALIFGKWKPYPTLVACLIFAFADASQARLQDVEVPLIGSIPLQFIQALPYVLTVLLLAGFVGKATPPRAIGVPYEKERN